MKCAKCGAELKVGCIYCSVCGQEAQIVSDSSLLEEELLRDLLKEENKPKQQTEKVTPPKKKKKSHKPLIIAMICLCLLIIAAVVLVVAIRNKNQNSYDYQVQKAEACVSEKNYTKALDYYKRALELKEDDITVRMDMVNIYLTMEEEKAAISLLHEIISMDPLNQEAYSLLIELYKKEEDYDAILKLKESVSDDRIAELFSEFSVIPPVFSQEPGTYDDYITIELKSEDGSTIYYTTDGSDPKTMGKVYEEPFVIEEQTSLNIRAVCCNEYGIYSEIAEGTFSVKFEKPRMPKANPDSGSFNAPTTIELIGTEGSRMYYTWDGSDPTVNSQEYTEPIPVPEGNHILSVILVDKHGMASDVLKCNYKYLP